MLLGQEASSESITLLSRGTTMPTISLKVSDEEHTAIMRMASDRARLSGSVMNISETIRSTLRREMGRVDRGAESPPSTMMNCSDSETALIHLCNDLSSKVSSEISSIARMVLMIDELPMGAHPRYEGGESIALVNSNKSPELRVSNDSYSIDTFETGVLIQTDVRIDAPPHEIETLTAPLSSSIIDTISNSEDDLLVSLLELATLKEHRTNHGGRCLEGMECSTIIHGTTPNDETIRALKGSMRSSPVIQTTPLIEESSAFILSPDPDVLGVLPIRQDITVIPCCEDDKIGVVAYEEVGMAIFDRKGIIHLSHHGMSGLHHSRIISVTPCVR